MINPHFSPGIGYFLKIKIKQACQLPFERLAPLNNSTGLANPISRQYRKWDETLPKTRNVFG